MKEGTIQKLIIEVDGKEYTLEYNRASIKKMEALGFNFNEVDKKIFTSIDSMIEAALAKNHPNIGQAEVERVIDDIYENYDLNALFSALTEMFMGAVPNFGLDGESEKTKSFKVVR